MNPRLLAFVYFIAAEALCLLLLPGYWRGLALLPVFGYWAAWVALGPGKGTHADTARLNLDPPGPGSMSLADELEWLERTGKIPPEVRYDVGGWISGPCLGLADPAAVPLAYRDGGTWGPIDPAGPGAPSLTPGPAALPPPPPAARWQPTRKADTAEIMLAPLAADCLNFMHDQDEDVRAYLLALADDMETARWRLRGAW